MPRLPAALRPFYPYLQPTYLRLNRLVAPATVRLSRGLLPTGTAWTMEEAAERAGGRCVQARAPEIIHRPPFVGRPADMPPLEPATDTDIPRIAVNEFPGGRVLGRSRAVITGAGDLLWEQCLYFGTTHPRQHPVYTNPFPGPPAEVPGRLGVLASRGDVNYYHFLIDVLPRVGVLEQAAGVAPVDRWYVPAHTRFQRQLLELMGIDEAHRIDADQVPHVRAECLVVPGLPSVVKEKNPPWVVEFLRGRLMAGIEPPAERRPLYITRTAGANNRAVVGEANLISFLQRRGFDVVDPAELSVVDQIRAFASASVIVSPHGAALANLVFATPGATVLELFPPSSVLPDYWRLAHSAGVTYRYLSTWSKDHKPHSRGHTIVTDIEVDLGALSEELDLLGVA